MYFPLGLLFSLAYLIPFLFFLLHVEFEERNAMGFEVFNATFYFEGRNEHGMWKKSQQYLKLKKYFCVLISCKGTNMCMYMYRPVCYFLDQMLMDI